MKYKALLFLLVFFACIQASFAHTLVFSDGTIIKGTIETVSENLVQINTKNGKQTFIRNTKDNDLTDTVVVGYLKKSKYRKIPCKVTFMDNEYVDMNTDQGTDLIHKIKVRDVTIYIPN